MKFEVIIAQNAGFCFGVKNAVESAEQFLKEKKAEGFAVFCLGELIHNQQINEKLADDGIVFVKNIHEIEDKKIHNEKVAVLIRAHGEGPETYKFINEKGYSFYDTTCPFVARIHKLVKEKFDEGFQIVIIGDPNHPEVKGINGWCNNSAIILNTVEDACAAELADYKIYVVAQTTITINKFNLVLDILQKKYDNVVVTDTICHKTSDRQSEAIKLAQNADVVLVIGGENSSNTQKLVELCESYCSRTYRINTVQDLADINFDGVCKVAITAGASTPDWIIREVIEKMDELNRLDTETSEESNTFTPELIDESNMVTPDAIDESNRLTIETKEEVDKPLEEKTGELSFEEGLEHNFKRVRTGQIVKGTIVDFNNSEVMVDMGVKMDGYIPMEEFIDDPDFDIKTSLKKGDEIEVYIVKVSDVERIILSKRRVDAIKNADIIYKLYSDKTPVKSKVIEIVKGGLVAYCYGHRVFIPASQVSDTFVEDLGPYLSEEIEYIITEFDKSKDKIVGSARLLLKKNKQSLTKEFWSNVAVGDEFNGVVKTFINPGAFITSNGVDGFLHISEISWFRIKHPSEALEIGQEIETKIKSIDREKKKISLAYKKAEDNPKIALFNKYNIGDVVKIKIKRMLSFGLFAEIEKGLEGFVHISEISDVRIAKPSDVLSIDQEVEAKIIEKDEITKKMALSIKAVKAINPSTPEGEAIDNMNDPEIPKTHKEEMNVTFGSLFGADKTNVEEILIENIIVENEVAKEDPITKEPKKAAKKPDKKPTKETTEENTVE